MKKLQIAENKVHTGIKKSLSVFCLCVLVCQSTNAQTYVIGADLSFMKQAEESGFAFKENGQARPCLQIFRDHGYNWIRLRLFHTPIRLPNDLDYTIASAREAKQNGFRFLLDIHYSDTWADPGKQFLPAAWEGKSHAELVRAVFEYTRSTMIALREAGVFPDMVQIGNEISNGMLWPDGKLPENWFDKFHSYGIKYDVIGQSYYPWWHGSLLSLRECLNWTAKAYQKDIYVVEAAYNWTPSEYIDTLAPFPESPEGQMEFLEEVNRIVLNVPDNRGRGIFWWEPAVSWRGTRSFFDEEGNVQPVIHVFDRYTRK